MKKWSAIMSIVGTIFVTQAHAKEASPPCKGSPRIVEACFTVHGRVDLAQGMGWIMWIVGTKRLLSVVGMAKFYPDGVDELPPEVTRLVLRGAPGDISVFGDYEVCPLSKDVPGQMRSVCINHASHLVGQTSAGVLIKPSATD